MAIRLVHVGVGVRGRHWLDIVSRHADFASVACVDESDQALQEARRHPGQEHGNFFSSFDEALSRVEADAALIASPTFTHADQTLKALNAGLPVLVEKPMAATLLDAVRVVEGSRAAARPVMVAENYRFYRAERTLRHLLQNEIAGSLHWVECVDRRDQPSHTQGPWVKTMAHPFLTEIAVHHFDSLRYLLARKPSSICALSSNLPQSGYEHEAAAAAIIEFEGGLPVLYGGSMGSARYEFALWVEGEKGDLWSDRRRVWWRPRGGRFFRPCRSVPVAKGDDVPYPNAGTVSMLNQFRDAVTRGQIPETSGEDNLWTLAMVESSILSHRERRRISIAEVFTPALRRQAGLASV